MLCYGVKTVDDVSSETEPIKGWTRDVYVVSSWSRTYHARKGCGFSYIHSTLRESIIKERFPCEKCCVIVQAHTDLTGDKLVMAFIDYILEKKHQSLSSATMIQLQLVREKQISKSNHEMQLSK